MREFTKIWRERLSQANKGRIPYNKGKTYEEVFGKIRSIEIKKKVGKSAKERMIGSKNINYGGLSKEHRQKVSLNHANVSGKNNPMWQGGISRLPYSFDFSPDLRFKIRQRDDFFCQFCGRGENGRVHSPHHIDYNKINCIEDNLITLCVSCNSRANKDRKKWELYFTILMELKLTGQKNKNTI